MSFEKYIFKIRQAETPFYARLKKIGKAVLAFNLPMPRVLDPVFNVILYCIRIRFEIAEQLSIIFFRYPVLRMKCASVGQRLRMEQIPDIGSNVKVDIGDDVYLSGSLVVSSGRIFPVASLKIGNRTFVGSNCLFSVAKSIEVGDDVLIASGCTISDYSGHPMDPAKRVAGLHVAAEEVRPVRIGNRVWLGRGVTVLPGVAIGDDAVIGARAVVTKDVPQGHICVGNPGRLLSRTVYDAAPTRQEGVDQAAAPCENAAN